jgi:hypothetical protein
MKKRRKKQRSTKLNIDVLEVRDISLVDEFGKCRASLCCAGGDGGIGGHTLIQIYDDAGEPRIELQVGSDNNPGIRLNMPNSDAGVSLAVNKGHGNGMSINDHEGKPLVTLGVSYLDSDDPRSPHPEVVVLDPGKRRAWSSTNGPYAIPSQEEVDEMTRQAREQ